MKLGSLVHIDTSKILYTEKTKWVYVLNEKEEPELFRFNEMGVLLEICKESKFYLSKKSETTVKILTTSGNIIYCKQRLLKEV